MYFRISCCINTFVFLVILAVYAEANDHFFTYLLKQGKTLRDNEAEKAFCFYDNEYLCAKIDIDFKTGELRTCLTNRSEWMMHVDLNENFEAIVYPHRISATEIDLDGKHDEVHKIISFHGKYTIQKHRRICLGQDEFYFSAPCFIWETSAWSDMEKEIFKAPSRKYLLALSLAVGMQVEEDNVLLAMISPELIVGAREVVDIQRLRKKVESSRAAEDSDDENMSASDSLPDYDLKTDVILDASTGRISVHTLCRGENAIALYMDEMIGSKGDKDVFALNFRAISKDETHLNSIAAESDENKTLSGKSTDPYRRVTIGKGEGFGKSIMIWEIAIWPRLVETMNANRAQKWAIRYPVRVELTGQFDDDSVQHEEIVELPIDYRTMLQMEKLRVASQ